MSELPPGHTLEVSKPFSFWRATIRDDMGRPVGIGESSTSEEEAVRKAFISLGVDK